MPALLTRFTVLTRGAAPCLAAALLAACGSSSGGGNTTPGDDTTAPVGTLVIDGGAAVTATAGVTLSLSATDAVGVTRMRLSTDGATYGAEEPYVTSKAMALPAGDGAKTVSALFGDAAGNWSAPASGSIVLDTTAPVGTVVIDGGAAVTATAGVTLSLSATDAVGVTRMRLSTDGVTYGAEEPYVTSKALTLPAGDGAKTVYALFGDAAGNWSAPASDGIVLDTTTPDTTAPVGTVVIDGGAAVTATAGVTLTLAATDAMGVTRMRLSTDGVTYGAEEPYVTSKALALPAGDGAKTVYALFGDAAGNWSAPASDSIVLDTTAPVVSAVAWSALGATTIRVTWTTDEPATSQVEFGTTASYGDLTAEAPALVSSHMVDVGGLAPVSSFHFRVRSRDATQHLTLGDDAVFTTPGTSADVSPPSVPAGLGATVISPTQVSLAWTASTDDVGVVAYDVYRDGALLGSIAAPPYQDTTVARGSTHAYEVRARDAAGNTSAPSAAASATTPALVLSGVTVASTTAASATIQWTTDVPATSRVEFGLTAAYGTATPTDPALTTLHTRTLTGLPAGTLHHFRAISGDAQGREVASADGTFQTNPPSLGSFQNEVLISGMALPTALKFTPDGDMLITELGGRIWRVPAGTTTLDPAPFLELTNVGSLNGQQGLMDVVLDPDFMANHHFYVFYTLGTPNRDRVSRFTANATHDGTVPGSEMVLYQDGLDANAEHHGGAMNFANDGKLLVTTGEHFNGSYAQDLTSPRGKVLRFNPDGTVPLDNPFYDGAGPNYDAIWALGLRNPYRASYDAPTGRLLIGDVGGNDYNTAVEELDLGVAGANFGWPNCEGNSCAGNPLYQGPLYSYPHAGRDAAITGGFVYRGTQFPASYVGSYFFADYTQNWIKRLTFDVNGNPDQLLNFEPPDGSADGPYGDIVYLTEGPDGALYYVDLGYSDTTSTFGISKIRRIRFVAGDLPPVAVASATPQDGLPPLQVHFSSAGSYDPEGGPITYAWTFGDGTTSTEANPVKTYGVAGPYSARLSVSDGQLVTLSLPIQIGVGTRPVPVISSPVDGAIFRAGDVIQISGNATDLEDGTLPASAFSWTVDFLHEGHVHPALPQTGTKSFTFPIPVSGHDFSSNTRYRITLTVTDSTGLTAARSVLIWPDKVNLTFTTVPPGRSLNLDGIAFATPFVHDTLKGFQHTVEAVDQTVGQNVYTFAAWSDGGARSHVIVVPEVDTSYSATFDVAQVAFPPGLVAGYRLDEGTGSSAADVSGNGISGVLTGGPTWTTGRYGGALSFGGTSYVDLGNPVPLHLTGSMTLTAWIHVSSNPTDDAAIVSKGDWLLKTTQDTGVRTAAIQIGTGTGNVQRYGATVLAPNTWYHVAGVYDAAARTLQVYLNGALDSGTLSGTVPAAQFDPPQNVQIGQRTGSPGTYNFIGTLDEIHVYGRALTPAEVQTDMNVQR